jgi:hypothetical protein
MKRMTFAIDILNEKKNTILETFNLQTGLECTDVLVSSESNLFNRLGETVLLELSFLTGKGKNESSDLSIAFLTKNLFDTEKSSEYSKRYQHFTNYIEDLNQKWDKTKKKIKIEPFFPDQIATVSIESSKDNIIAFNTLNRFIKRDKSGIPGNMRYKIMGYALGRFHSQEFIKVPLDPYKPYFQYLKDLNFDEKVISQWEKEFSKIKGSSYIIGDCSLENVQYNALQPGKGKLDSLCLVDPVFLQNRDRYEDISGVLAALGREIVYSSLISKPDGSLRELLAKTFRSILEATEELFSTYIVIHPTIHTQTPVTADFFVGTFLLQYSYQYPGEDAFSSSYRDVLQVLGTQFLSDQPIKAALIKNN